MLSWYSRFLSRKGVVIRQVPQCFSSVNNSGKTAKHIQSPLLEIWKPVLNTNTMYLLAIIQTCILVAYKAIPAIAIQQRPGQINQGLTEMIKYYDNGASLIPCDPHRQNAFLQTCAPSKAFAQSDQNLHIAHFG